MPHANVPTPHAFGHLQAATRPPNSLHVHPPPRVCHHAPITLSMTVQRQCPLANVRGPRGGDIRVHAEQSKRGIPEFRFENLKFWKDTCHSITEYKKVESGIILLLMRHSLEFLESAGTRSSCPFHTALLGELPSRTGGIYINPRSALPPPPSFTPPLPSPLPLLPVQYYTFFSFILQGT
jgi:hypothetical protein